jgi:ACS family hexuronate transporter-like MFS transporter
MTSSGRGHLRWWICFIIFLATLIIYSDRQFLSLLKSTLADQIHWNDSQFGQVNACFLGAYAVGLLFFGRIIDRIGVKAGYAATLLLWSLAALSHTLVTSVGGFMAARIFLGLSEAGNFPAAVKAITQWFPQAERAFATTLFNSGANVGAIVAPFLVAWLLQFSTWHAPFLVAGAAGLAWVTAWLPFLCAAGKTSLGLAGRTRLYSQRPRVRRRKMRLLCLGFNSLRYPQAWSFIVAKFLTDPVGFFFSLAARLFQENPRPRHQGRAGLIS